MRKEDIIRIPIKNIFGYKIVDEMRITDFHYIYINEYWEKTLFSKKFVESGWYSENVLNNCNNVYKVKSNYIGIRDYEIRKYFGPFTKDEIMTKYEEHNYNTIRIKPYGVHNIMTAFKLPHVVIGHYSRKEDYEEKIYVSTYEEAEKIIKIIDDNITKYSFLIINRNTQEITFI